jgi:hypothetical protein
MNRALVRSRGIPPKPVGAEVKPFRPFVRPVRLRCGVVFGTAYAGERSAYNSLSRLSSFKLGLPTGAGYPVAGA